MATNLPWQVQLHFLLLWLGMARGKRPKAGSSGLQRLPVPCLLSGWCSVSVGHYGPRLGDSVFLWASLFL